MPSRRPSRAPRRTHAGEIRFAIETSLAAAPRPERHAPPRARALEVFAHLRVWDTAHNNGVLIYVQLADRAVEIVADRGLREHIQPSEWEAVCRLMEQHFRERRYRAGAIAGVEAVGTLLARHYPAAADDPAAGRATNCLIGRLCCR